MSSSESRMRSVGPAETGVETHLLASRPDLALAALGGEAALRTGASIAERVSRARVATHLGAQRLALALDRGSFSLAPDHPEAIVAWGRHLRERRGAHWTLDWLERVVPNVSPSARSASRLLSFEARLHAELRDPVRAEALLRRADEGASEHERVYILADRAAALDTLDEHAEALRLVEDALSLAPRYHFTAYLRSELLRKLAGVAAGLEVLRDAEVGSRHFVLAYGRAILALELGFLDEAVDAIDRCRACATLADRVTLASIDSLDFRVRLERGERDEMLALARRLRFDDVYLGRIEAAERLPSRVAIPVPFIAQKHVTCAPATLTAIARHFGDPVAQEDAIEAMCFAGSPHHLQRRWCEGRGFRAIDFTLTHEAGRALVDRGLPFVLVTHQIASSHAQCVRGYDPVTRDWLVMDPSSVLERRLDMDALAEREAWIGPMAMLVLPESKAHLLADLELPDVRARELLHQLECALEVGDRSLARALAAEIDETATSAAVRFDSRVRLAHSTRDFVSTLDAIVRWREEFPNADRLVYMCTDASCSAKRPRDERLELLAPAVRRGDPSMLALYARELMMIPGRADEARRVLRRAIRVDGAHSSYPIGLLGEIELRMGDYTRAARELRVASCIDEGYVWAARQYFVAASAIGRSAEALEHLERRVRVTRSRASEPAMTLFDAYRDAGRASDGLALLEDLARDRPDDGSLALACADAHLAVGSIDAAERWVDAAAGRTDPTSVATVRARCRAQRGAPREAAETLARVVAGDRFDNAARTAYLEYLASISSQDELFDTCERLMAEAPDDPTVLTTVCPYLRPDPSRERRVLEAYLAERPSDPWALRELAITHSGEGNPEAAIAVLDEVLRENPDDESATFLRASALQRMGRTHEAYEGFRRTLDLDPDHEYALSDLIDTCPDAESLRAFAERHVRRLIAQGTLGGGVRGMIRLRERLLDGEVLAWMTTLKEAFPELAVVFESTAELALECGRTDECEAIVVEGAKRFPDSVGLKRVEIALAHRLRDFPRALAVARRIAERWPMDEQAIADLGDELVAAGQAEEAMSVYREALGTGAYLPYVAQQLARLLDSRDEPEEALGVLLSILPRVRPSSDAWSLAVALARPLARLEDVEAIIEARVGAHPWSAELWLRLGEVRRGEARLAAYQEALKVSPTSWEAHDLLAVERALRREFDLARAHCSPPEWTGEIPVTLRGRRAWVDAEQGRMDDAIATMREIVREAPNYRWGIERLIEWTRAHRGPEERIEALGALAALDRADGACREELGEALVALGRYGDALEPLREAVRLDPRAPSALVWYVESLVELARLDEAREVVGNLSAEVDEGVRLAVRLLVRERTRGVVAALDALAASDLSMFEPRHVWAVARVFRRDAERLCERLEVMFRSGSYGDPAASSLAELYIETLRMKDLRMGQTLLRRADELGDAGVEALGRLLEELAWSDDSSHQRLALRLVRRRRRYLRRHTRTWGAAGAVLTRLGKFGAARRWLADYRRRDGVGRWMITNFIVAAGNVGRVDETYEAAQFGATLDDDTIGDVIDEQGALLAAARGDRVVLPAPSDEGLRRPIAELAALLDVVRATHAAGDDVATKLDVHVARVTDAGFDAERMDHVEPLLLTIAATGGIDPRAEARPMIERLAELGEGRSPVQKWVSLQAKLRHSDGVERHLRTRLLQFLDLTFAWVALAGVPVAYIFSDGRPLSFVDGLVPFVTAAVVHASRIVVRSRVRWGIALVPYLPALVPLAALTFPRDLRDGGLVLSVTVLATMIPWRMMGIKDPGAAARALSRWRRDEASTP
jgi:cellulose synthase operon protein C